MNREFFENKTNDEILLIIKKLQMEHEALKNNLIKGYDKLLQIEEDFKLANKIILERLKGK